MAKFVSVDGGAATLERRYLFAPDGTQLAESEAGFETYWILTDGQGSTSNVAQWDGSKHVDAEKSRYDGNGLLRYTETPVGTVDLQLFTRYAGRPYDSLVHLADYRGRAYDPVVGRFLTSRPAAAGGNGYANPDGTAELVDPTLTKVADTTWGTAAWQVVGGVGSSIYRGIRDGALDVWDTGKSVFNAALDPIGTARRIGGAIGAAGQRLAVAWHDPGQAWANVKSGVGAVAQYAWQSFTNDPVRFLARAGLELFTGKLAFSAVRALSRMKLVGKAVSAAARVMPAATKMALAAGQKLGVLDELCFAPETLVSTLEGPRALCDVNAGHYVAAFDFHHGEWKWAEVLQRHKNSYTGNLYTVHVGGQPIEVTMGHPFWVADGSSLHERPLSAHLTEHEDEGSSLEGRWVDSHELRIGDVLVGIEGRRYVVESIEERFVESFTVANLTVRGHHTFAVGDAGVLVHNKGYCDVLREAGINKPAGLAGLVHGHHIVMKGAWSHMPGIKKWNDKSKKILSDLNIDLLADVNHASEVARSGAKLHNLTWAALRWENHNATYAKHVYQALKYARTNAETGRQAEAVKQMLGLIAEEMNKGKVFRFVTPQ